MDDATSTSRCIGNPVTPLCAVETYWACFRRRRPELCDMVQAGVRPLPNVTRRPDSREEYRVIYAHRPSPLDPVDPATEGDTKPQPGDIIIGLMNRTCYGPVDDDSDCEIGVENDPPHVHMLRLDHIGAVIVAVAADRAAELERGRIGQAGFVGQQQGHAKAFIVTIRGC